MLGWISLRLHVRVQLLHDMREQAVASILYQVQHMVETLCIAVIRIGDHRAVMAQVEVC